MAGSSHPSVSQARQLPAAWRQTSRASGTALPAWSACPCSRGFYFLGEIPGIQRDRCCSRGLCASFPRLLQTRFPPLSHLLSTFAASCSILGSFRGDLKFFKKILFGGLKWVFFRLTLLWDPNFPWGVSDWGGPGELRGEGAANSPWSHFAIPKDILKKSD